MRNPTHHTRRAGHRWGRIVRNATGALVPGAAAAMMLLVILPTVLAAGPNTTTIKAPFTTAVVKLTNPTTHAGGFSDNASAKWKATATNNSAFATGRMQITIPITIATTARHTVQAVWITVSTGSVNLTAGTCKGNASIASTSCTRFVQAFVFGFATLVDKTNGSTINVENWPGNHTAVWSNTTCAFLACTTSASTGHTSRLHTGKAFWSFDWTNVALVSTHSYTVQMTLFGGSQVTLMVIGATLSSGSGNAQFNSGTGGNHQTLSSINIT
ncbi:MAG: hypothetical protein L3J91_01800 [Thermoplasmata archaeon]|nr:hypothetical protein [Thermoplasmata archaeon]